MEIWSGVLEWSIGVESNFGVTAKSLLSAHKMESSCDVCMHGQVICNMLIVMHQ